MVRARPYPGDLVETVPDTVLADWPPRHSLAGTPGRGPERLALTYDLVDPDERYLNASGDLSGLLGTSTYRTAGRPTT